MQIYFKKQELDSKVLALKRMQDSSASGTQSLDVQLLKWNRGNVEESGEVHGLVCKQVPGCPEGYWV